MRRLLVLCGVAAAWLGVAPGALAISQTSHSGSVTATFTFAGAYSGERLTIARAGSVVYDRPVSSKLCAGACGPGSLAGERSSVHVLSLEPGGNPDVVLDLESGGAHCCWIVQVFSYDPARAAYVRSERNFGDVGERVADLGHNRHLEFLSADDSFAYAFTDFAASGFPIQILSFSQRRFHDITRSFPKLIAADAGRWRRLFEGMARQHYRDSVGVISAWAADEELLGHGALVSSYLAGQAKAGHLHSAFGVGGQAFVWQLKAFLRQHGYLR